MEQRAISIRIQVKIQADAFSRFFIGNRVNILYNPKGSTLTSMSLT